LGANPGQLVDHWNRDGLDNRRCNLRIANYSQNAANSGPSVRNTSGYKGVTFSRRADKWQAGIQVNGKFQFLGHWATREDAARAYDAAATKFFGEFAHLNFPLGD
jgi:hypothetical protein